MIPLNDGQERYLSARCFPPQAWYSWCPQYENFFSPTTGGHAIGWCEELGYFGLLRTENPRTHNLVWAQTPEEFIPETDLVSDLCVYGSYYIPPTENKLHKYVTRNTESTHA